MTQQAAIHRRTLLQAGTAALFGSATLSSKSAANPLSAESSFGRTGGRAKHCILIYLLGGPPHLDMWDLKPDAPAEIRGPFLPIQTKIPGMQVGEHLPRLAEQANHLAILRSLTYNNADHPFMTYYTLTGRISRRGLGANTILAPSRDDDPHMGSVISRYRHEQLSVPGYVAIPEVRVRMKLMPIAGGGRAGFMGASFDPLAVNEDPRDPKNMASLSLPKEVPPERFEDRRELLAVLDGYSPKRGETQSHTAVRRAAMRLSRSTGGDGLFSLDREPVKLRECYGMHRFGQSLLLARRLVERGVSFSAIHFNHMTKCDGWDTHKNNFGCLQNELLPMVDQGVSSLLADLSDRGLLDETLVVMMGEFGRTPRINAGAGRDHWGLCSSVMLAGGGVQGGNIVGSSDATGSEPTAVPVGPPDLVSTIYHALGLNPAARFFDPRLNREVALCEGHVIKQLF